MLYLKHDKFTITIASKQQTIPIYLQTNLEKVDSLVKAGLAVELDGAIEFDFKLAEFYYLKDMRKDYSTQAGSMPSSITAWSFIIRTD